MQPLRVVESEPDISFPSFWLLYPRRVAKRDAEKAWLKLGEHDRLAAIVGAARWRRVWAQMSPEFIPHASTWLNGARWEDELPAEQVSNHAAHQPAKFAEAERGEMPAEVKAMLAKLKAGR